MTLMGNLVCFITFFYITHVYPQCNKPPLLSPFVTPSCCLRVSDAAIHESVDACFEQKENTSDHCKIHAYILTKKEKAWCVDPRAWWLPDRLKKLERRGICCKTLMRPNRML